MIFEARQGERDSILLKGAEMVEIATGFGFVEGPIWHPTKQYLVFSDIAESRQYRWSAPDDLSLFRQPSNQANGNCFDRNGQVISCEHASSHLVRHDHGGKRVTILASHFEGRELNSPNDVVCDRKGRIWFTDPSYGRTREDLGILRDQQQPCQGVYRLDPDGTLHLMVDDFQQPNGLCLSEDERRLFVNDTVAAHIRVFDLDSAGQLSGGRVWADVTGQRPGVADGMKLTAEGYLLCNGPGGVHVFDREAACLGVILTPQKSTNFCFGGKGLHRLFITASSSVYAVDTHMTGLAMI